MRSSLKMVAGIIAVCAATSFLGCGVAINPYVRGNDKWVLQDPSITNAVYYARDTRQAYYDAIRDSTLMNRGTGAILIGASAAAAALGITGGSTGAITGLAVGGAGLFGIDRLIYSERRLRVYAEGARSITCALAAFESARAGTPTGLDDDITELSVKLAELRTAMAQVTFRDDFRFREGAAALDLGQATLSRGRSLQTQLRTAGVRLWDTVESIRATVNKTLLLDEPDLAQLTATLNQSIRTQSGLIGGVPFPAAAAAPPSGERNKAPADQDDLLDRVARKAVEVERAAAAVETQLTDISNPSAQRLGECALNTDGAGVSLSVVPMSISIDTAVDTPTGRLVVSGGKPPYVAQWVGNSPGAQATVDGVDHGEGTNRGVITIRPVKNAAGNFQLLVSDQNSSPPVVVPVTLQGTGSSAAPGGAQVTKTNPTTPADLELKRIQTALVALKCLNPTLDNGKPSDDGHWGAATQTAIVDLATALGTPNDQINSLFPIAGGPPPVTTMDEMIASARRRTPPVECTPIAPPPNP